MASTTFSRGTRITSDWLNSIDALVYDVLNGISSAPTAGTIFRSDGTHIVPSTFTIPNTFAANDLIYASSANTLTALAKTNSAILRTNGSGVPGWDTTALPVSLGGTGLSVAGTDGYVLSANSGASAGNQYLAPGLGTNIINGYLTWTVSTNILTVALKGLDGNNPSATNPVFIRVRSTTDTNGLPTLAKITSSLSMTISTSLGTQNSIPFRLWAVLIDNAGNGYQLGVGYMARLSAAPTIMVDVSDTINGWNVSATSPSGTTAGTVYTHNASAVNRPFTILGNASWESGLATAGTWSSGPTRVKLHGPGDPKPGEIIQTASQVTGEVSTGTTVIPLDDTIPQNTEGDQYLVKNISPTSTANLLEISYQLQIAHTVSVVGQSALFQDSVSDALASSTCATVSGSAKAVALFHRQLSGTTSSTSFKVRAGGNGAGTMTFNGAASARQHGGVLNSYLIIREVML